MKANKTKRNNNNTGNAKVNQNRKQIKKEQYISGLHDKPSIELAEVGIPLSMEAYPDTDDAQTLVAG